MDSSVDSFVPLGSYQTQHRFITTCGSLLPVCVPHGQDKTASFTLGVLSLECIILKSQKWLGLAAVSWIKLGRLNSRDCTQSQSQSNTFADWLNSPGNGSQVKILCNDFSFYMLKVLEIAFPGPWFEVLFSDVCYLFPSWNLIPSMGIHLYLRLYNSCYQSFQRCYCSCLCSLLLSL